MLKIKTLRKTIVTSLIPFGVGSLCFLVEKLLENSLLLVGKRAGQVFSSKNVSSLLWFFKVIKERCFDVYEDFLSLLLFMLISGCLIQVLHYFKKSLMKKIKDSELQENQSKINNSQIYLIKVAKTKKGIKGVLPKILSIILTYVLLSGFIFGCLSLFKAYSFPFENEMTLQNFPQEKQRAIEPLDPINDLEEFNSLIENQRMLTVKTPEYVKVLKVINAAIAKAVLSSNERIAYTSYNGKFQIMDVTNPKIPLLLGSVGVDVIDLRLSPDEKTVYIVNLENLKVIDVSNLHSPKVIASIKVYYYEDKSNYSGALPSIELSKDGKTAFVGGLGFYILDISEKTNPLFLYENRQLTWSVFSYLPMHNAFYLVSKEKFEVYSAVYSASDLKPPSLLASFPRKENQTPFSIQVSKNEEQVYLASYNTNKLVVQFIDIHRLTSLTYREEIELKISKELNASPNIILSPDEKNLYYVDSADLLKISLFDLTITKILEKEFHGAFSMVLWSNSRTALVGKETYSLFVELREDTELAVPEFQIKPNLIGSVSFAEKEKGFYIAISKDEKFIYTLGGEGEEKRMKIHSFSHQNYLTTPLGSLSFKHDSFYSLHVSRDKNTLFAFGQTKLAALDVSDPENPTRLQTLDLPCAHGYFETSEDGKLGFLSFPIKNGMIGDFAELWFLDLSDLRSIKKLNSLDLNKKYLMNNYKGFYFSKDGKRVFYALKDNLYMIDYTNPSSPATSSIYNLKGTSDMSLLFSNDEKTVFIILKDEISRTLVILDMLVYNQPKLLSSNILPSIEEPSPTHIILSPDERTAVIKLEKGFLFLNISNLSAPVGFGSAETQEFAPSSNLYQKKLIFSENGTSIYRLFSERIFICSIIPTFKLEIPKSFKLGKPVTVELKTLQWKTRNFYNSIDRDYKFTKVTFYTEEIEGHEKATLRTHSPLPTWAHFDKENGELTLDPKSYEYLGEFHLYSAISTKITKDSFSHINDNKDFLQDLMSLLLSSNYIDSEYFLTSYFSPNQALVLNTQFNQHEDLIRKNLAKSYFEMVSKISVVQSISLNVSKPITVDTPIAKAVHVTIKIENDPDDIQAFFINKVYEGVITTISQQKTLLTMEGSLSDVNHALERLVVDLENSTSYQGSITIDDGMNPLLVQSLQNLSDCFLHNKPPNLTKYVQEQISKVPVSTGQYFSIQLDSKSFQDSFVDSLEYSLEMQDGTHVPKWLDLRGLTLSGIPPEQIRGNTIELILVARNEGKATSESFTLNVKISLTYGLKLLSLCIGYIVTGVGFLVYAKKAYNIVMQKKYRHHQDFVLEIGEEINDSVIYPIAFIEEEARESRLIIEKLEEHVAREMRVKKITKFQLVSYFYNQHENKFNQNKLNQTLGEIAEEMTDLDKRKIKNYFRGTTSTKQIVLQLIINEFVMIQLDQEEPTKKVFKRITQTNSWIDLVYWEDSFKIDKAKLEQRLKSLHLNFHCMEEGLKTGSKQNEEELQLKLLESAETSVQEESQTKKASVNIELLAEAISVHAFRYQNIEVSIENVSVVCFYQPMGDSFLQKIKRYLKKDLKPVPFAGQDEVGFGIKYKIKEVSNVMYFHGTPWPSFQEKTLVLQIMESGKIQRELWFSGVPNKSNLLEIQHNDNNDREIVL